MDLDHARAVAVTAAEAAGDYSVSGTRGAPAPGRRAVRRRGHRELDLASEKCWSSTSSPPSLTLRHRRGVGPAGRRRRRVGMADHHRSTATTRVISGPARPRLVGLALCRSGRPMLGVVHGRRSRPGLSAIRRPPRHILRGTPAPQHNPSPHGPLLAWTQGYSVSRSDTTVRAIKYALELGARTRRSCGRRCCRGRCWPEATSTASSATGPRRWTCPRARSSRGGGHRDPGARRRAVRGGDRRHARRPQLRRHPPERHARPPRPAPHPRRLVELVSYRPAT